ncbi:PaaI family thioesterase [Dermacoccus barathri]|uniref:Acyl-coenzyme A thioesterase THEM4 n=1 Tax=Dermacoccus barathri TaxID=322601 RepID=A0ABN2BGJ6_9MICO
MTERDAIAALHALREITVPPETIDAHDSVATQIRELLDLVAASRLDAAQAAEITEHLREVNTILRGAGVPEPERVWGRVDTVGRAQALVPPVVDGTYVRDSFSGSVRFGTFHVGENSVVHGGAICLLFDDVLGALALEAELDPSRTAYLTVNFRSVAPVDETLTVTATVDRIEGRKQFIRGSLWAGERLCAEAEGLWVALKPGQP